MLDKALIEALGGASQVGRLIDVAPQAVSNWKSRGIPAHAWPAVRDLARQRGIKVAPELEAAMIEASKRAMRRSAPEPERVS